MKPSNTDLKIIRESVYGQTLAIEPWTSEYFLKETPAGEWKNIGADKKKAYTRYSAACRLAEAKAKFKYRHIRRPDPIEGLKKLKLNEDLKQETF